MAKTWGEIFNKYTGRGCDHSDAAFRADQYMRIHNRNNERVLEARFDVVLEHCQQEFSQRESMVLHPLKNTHKNDVSVIAAQLWLEGYRQGLNDGKRKKGPAE